MALYKAIDILKLADSKHTAALAFNCADYNMVHSVAVAAETVQKPVICMLHPDHHRIENWITPELFAKYRTAEEFAQADPSELEPIIRRCGYYRAKGANIIGACRKIAEEFGGRVPETMEELTSLPGVGRKTANVVLGDAFDVPGLPVDTHVKRLVRLIGLVRQEDPVKIEAELCAHLDPGRWSQFSHLLIVHGRTVCKANRPACEGCVLQTICKYGKKHVVQK